jgi:hypothetical protein
MQVPTAHWSHEFAWKKYCGFADLPVEGFQVIQASLLTEQVRLLAGSKLGQRLLRLSAPRSVQEFRETVPLTSYADYVRYLDQAQTDVLPDRDCLWVHTTGAQARHKWVPFTGRAYIRTLDNLMGAFIFSTARERDDVRVGPGSTVMYNVPPRPYLSGMVAFGMRDRFGLRGVLDPEAAEQMEFSLKVRKGFEEALETSVDLIVSMTSVLVRAGEAFENALPAPRRDRPRRKVTIRAAAKVTAARAKAFVLRRAPRAGDVWKPKGLIGWGADTGVFRPEVERYWGSAPYEIYACTEGGVMGMETWEREGLIFNPYAAFFEFIPEQGAATLRTEGGQVETKLLDEVRPGETYEVVISSFYGMPFTRYRLGHFVRFKSEPTGGWKGGRPLFEFVGRADQRIDIAGFTRIDEKTLWEAIKRAGLPFREWTARSERAQGAPDLHIYAERVPSAESSEQAGLQLHRALRELDPFYRDLEDMLHIRPLKLTLLPEGTWQSFYDRRRKEGRPFVELQPPRINPGDTDVEELLETAA